MNIEKRLPIHVPFPPIPTRDTIPIRSPPSNPGSKNNFQHQHYRFKN